MTGEVARLRIDGGHSIIIPARGRSTPLVAARSIGRTAPDCPRKSGCAETRRYALSAAGSARPDLAEWVWGAEGALLSAPDVQTSDGRSCALTHGPGSTVISHGREGRGAATGLDDS